MGVEKGWPWSSAGFSDESGVNPGQICDSGDEVSETDCNGSRRSRREGKDTNKKATVKKLQIATLKEEANKTKSGGKEEVDVRRLVSICRDRKARSFLFFDFIFYSRWEGTTSFASSLFGHLLFLCT